MLRVLGVWAMYFLLAYLIGGSLVLVVFDQPLVPRGFHGFWAIASGVFALVATHEHIWG